MVETFRGFVDKIDKYFAFSRKELIGLALVIIALSFMVGFNDGRPEFQLSFWLMNLIGCFFIVLLSVLAAESVRRLWALHRGYKVVFNPWYMGLFAGIIVTLLSNGYLAFLAYGGITIAILKTHRIGKFRYGLSYNELGIIALLGPATNLFLAVLFKALMFMPNTYFIEKAIIINVGLALLNMLPIPPLNGANVFFTSPVFYILSLGAMVGMGIMLLKTSLLTALVGGLLMSVIFLVAYKFVIEPAL